MGTQIGAKGRLGSLGGGKTIQQPQPRQWVMSRSLSELGSEFVRLQFTILRVAAGEHLEASVADPGLEGVATPHHLRRQLKRGFLPEPV